MRDDGTYDYLDESQAREMVRIVGAITGLDTDVDSFGAVWDVVVAHDGGPGGIHGHRFSSWGAWWACCALRRGAADYRQWPSVAGKPA